MRARRRVTGYEESVKSCRERQKEEKRKGGKKERKKGGEEDW